MAPMNLASLPSFLTMKERVGCWLSNTVPDLRILKSVSPAFLTVATILSSGTEETLSTGLERDTSRPPTARAVGLAYALMVARARVRRGKETILRQRDGRALGLRLSGPKYLPLLVLPGTQNSDAGAWVSSGNHGVSTVLLATVVHNGRQSI